MENNSEPQITIVKDRLTEINVVSVKRLLAENARLRKDVERIGHERDQMVTANVALQPLASFGREVVEWVIANDFWGDAGGDDFMPLMEKHGLAQRVPYDPAVHGDEIDAEAGDLIWWIDATRIG